MKQIWEKKKGEKERSQERKEVKAKQTWGTIVNQWISEKIKEQSEWMKKRERVQSQGLFSIDIIWVWSDCSTVHETITKKIKRNQVQQLKSCDVIFLQNTCLWPFPYGKLGSQNFPSWDKDQLFWQMAKLMTFNPSITLQDPGKSLCQWFQTLAWNLPP